MFLCLLWVTFIAYTLRLAPLDRPETLILIQKMLKFQLEGINPYVATVFALMGVWPMVYACFIFIDEKTQNISALACFHRFQRPRHHRLNSLLTPPPASATIFRPQRYVDQNIRLPLDRDCTFTNYSLAVSLGLVKWRLGRLCQAVAINSFCAFNNLGLLLDGCNISLTSGRRHGTPRTLGRSHFLGSLSSSAVRAASLSLSAPPSARICNRNPHFPTDSPKLKHSKVW